MENATEIKTVVKPVRVTEWEAPKNTRGEIDVKSTTRCCFVKILNRVFAVRVWDDAEFEVDEAKTRQPKFMHHADDDLIESFGIEPDFSDLRAEYVAMLPELNNTVKEIRRAELKTAYQTSIYRKLIEESITKLTELGYTVTVETEAGYIERNLKGFCMDGVNAWVSYKGNNVYFEYHDGWFSKGYTRGEKIRSKDPIKFFTKLATSLDYERSRNESEEATLKENKEKYEALTLVLTEAFEPTNGTLAKAQLFVTDKNRYCMAGKTLMELQYYVQLVNGMRFLVSTENGVVLAYVGDKWVVATRELFATLEALSCVSRSTHQ